jgi:hypothetical protein
MSAPTPTSPIPPIPTIDAIHRDVAFANSYRLELIRLLMTLSAALLAFTVTFRPDLKQVLWSQAMWLGWFGLAISMVGGMIHMYGWDRYYMTFRDYDHKHRDNSPPNDGRSLGKRERGKINRWRRWAMGCQFGGFAIGVASVAVFAAANVDGKRTEEPAGSPKVSVQTKTATVTSQG